MESFAIDPSPGAAGHGFAWLGEYQTPVLIVVSICVVLVSGMIAGLTLGLMSLDKIDLEIIASTSSAEAPHAQRILPIREKGNLLLVTLLLANTALNEVLPLLLESIPGGNGAIAFVASTVSIMFFGEIIPQSICSRHGLAVGAHLAWFVKFLRLIFFPLAFPIAWTLDKILGQELGTVYSKDELKGLIEVHSRNKYGVLSEDETTILKGALDFSHKAVAEVMTPIEDVYLVSADTIVDFEFLRTCWERGHSRIPVYEGNADNIVAIMLVKNLILVNPSEKLRVRDLLTDQFCRPPAYVPPEAKLDAMLNVFQSGRTHLAIVRQPDGPVVPPLLPTKWKNIGICTLEDVIEELIQEEIVDETDQFIDIHKRVPILRKPGGGLLLGRPLKLAGGAPSSANLAGLGGQGLAGYGSSSNLAALAAQGGHGGYGTAAPHKPRERTGSRGSEGPSERSPLLAPAPAPAAAPVPPLPPSVVAAVAAAASEGRGMVRSGSARNLRVTRDASTIPPAALLRVSPAAPSAAPASLAPAAGASSSAGGLAQLKPT
eukprot:tig00000058_g743.t1